MTHLSTIPGIGKASLELLEAAGFLDAESLAKAGADELVVELERANRMLQIAKRAPSQANVAKWISSARDLTGQAKTSHETVMPVNYEKTPQVVSLLAAAPFAIPLPARQLMEKQLAVSDIPAAIFLNRYSGDLEVRVEERIPQAPQGRPAASSSFVQIADNGQERMQIDSSRLRSTETMTAGKVRTYKTKQVSEEDRVALIRGPREKTNHGRDPKSRFYIRGVLHSHPLSMTFAAIVTLALAIMVPTGVISALLLLLSDQMPAYFSWVPKWLLAFPLALPLFGLFYLIFALRGTCRICGQKQFVPRACLKNIKAHHIPGLGHILPVSIHIILFRWFRCTYCGTPVRLKK